MNNTTITISPFNMSGEPTLGDRKIAISTLADHVLTFGVDATCTDYEISRAEVLVACWFLGSYGITTVQVRGKHSATPLYRVAQDRRTIKKWRKWAEKNAAALRNGDYDNIPNPPLSRWEKPVAPAAQSNNLAVTT